VSVTDCSLQLLDLTFVVDSSGSINYYVPTNYDKQLEFIVDVVNEFTIGPNDVQVALVLFSLEASVEWGLTEYQDKDSLIDAIRNLRYLDSWTNLNDALFLTHSEVYKPGNGVRDGAPRVTIIVTDGVDNIPEEGTPLTLENATRCKDEDIWLIAIGITDGVDEDRLKQITSPSDYYFVDDFDGLTSIVGDLKDQICEPRSTGHFSSFKYSFLYFEINYYISQSTAVGLFQSLQFAEKVTYVQVTTHDFLLVLRIKFVRILKHLVL